MMKNQELLDRMLLLATQSHAGQFDKGGNPYILHPIAVMHMLNTDDEELKCIALGHDLIEDTGVTADQLIRMGFSNRIVFGIECLTKVDGESFEEYKEKVKSNYDAIKVKMCDLRHNSDLTRLKGVTDKDLHRAARYMQFYYELRMLDENKI